jgi:periplasmic protein TonB
MDMKRTRRLLIVAFALSLLIHAVVATRIHWSYREPTENVQIVHVQRITHEKRIALMPTPPAHTPSPPPTPIPTHVPSAPPRSVKPLGKPAAHGNRHAPVGVAAATPAPTQAPTPAATATPATATCAKTNTPAQLAASPPPPEIAPQVRAQALSGTATVRVDLDASGAVQNATVIESTGNTSLDFVALSMAKSAQYTPAYENCKAVASTYNFSAKFIAW